MAVNRPILFVCNVHAGQTNCLVAVAAELSRRGVPDLWFATRSRYRADIEAATTNSKINFIPLDEPEDHGTDVIDSEILAVMQRGPMRTDGLVAFNRTYLDFARSVEEYRRMLDVIDSLDPVRMVIDVLTYPAIDAAMTRGVPFALTVPSLPSSTARTPWNYPSGLTDLPRRMNVRQLATNVLFGLRIALAMIARTSVVQFAKKRKAMGIKNPNAKPSDYVEAAALVLASSVFGLEYEFPAPPQVNLVGAFVSEASTGSAEDPDLSRWLDENDSVVYMGFGTLMQLSRDQVGALLGAIERLGPEHKFLWKLPAAQQKLLPAESELPSNLRVENWIPSQLDVLAHPHVRTFVTHGGSNGFHESMYFGTPVLVVPAWVDCYAIGRRAVDSGVGLAFRNPNNITSGELVDMLHRLLTDNTFTERAEYWSARVREAGGAPRAADLVLSMGTPSP